MWRETGDISIGAGQEPVGDWNESDDRRKLESRLAQCHSVPTPGFVPKTPRI